MSFGVGTYALGLLAGVLTTLSPCVLPLVPVLMTAAMSEHRLGPWALALGVGASFAVGGTLLAASGLLAGSNGEAFRAAAAVLLVACGVVLFSRRLQGLLSRLATVVSGPAGTWVSRFGAHGLAGQLALGVLLGLVWSPCVGPTLGAATALAAQGQSLAEVGLLMGLFGVGASLPMVLVGSASRVALARLRGSLATAGRYGRPALGVALVLLGVLLLTHGDRRVEAFALDHTPAWLVALTTRY